jgi:hypothetical protein
VSETEQNMTEEREEFSETRQRAVDLRKGSHTYKEAAEMVSGDLALELDELRTPEPGQQN